MKFFRLFAVILPASLFLSFDIPVGWLVGGSTPNNYEMGIDHRWGGEGKNTATIKCIDANVQGYATLMQKCLPDKFKVSRIRFTGLLKTEGVTDWSGFWLRVDEQDAEQPLSFDNMFDRGVKGTTDWTRYEIVVDVPANASVISYGALLSGGGQIWFDDLRIEMVDQTVATTGQGNDYGLPHREPLNLNFEN
jgi:hypothetical protein